MKKTLLIALLALTPNLGFSANTLNNAEFNPDINIPSKFVSTSRTDTLEWGCPIADVVQASSSEEAIDQLGRACMEDVKKAAVEKPGVFDVINVSVVWPDLQISHTKDGYKLEGTIFLETLVMKGVEN
jgi:hypothetical protein